MAPLWQLLLSLASFFVVSSAQGCSSHSDSSDSNSCFVVYPSDITIGSVYGLIWQQDFKNGYDLYVTTDDSTVDSGRKVTSFDQDDDQTFNWKVDLNNTGWDPKQNAYIYIFLSEQNGPGYAGTDAIQASSASPPSSTKTSSTTSSTSMSRTQTIPTITPTKALQSSSSATTTATPTSSPEPAAAAPSHTGAIAGGVVGGVAGLAALAGALVLLRRFRRKPDHPEDGSSSVGGHGPDPYATAPMLGGGSKPSPWTAVLPKFARPSKRNSIPSVVQHNAPPYDSAGFGSPPSQGQQKTFYDAGVASAAGVAGTHPHPDGFYSPTASKLSPSLTPPGPGRVVSQMTTVSRISELPSDFPHRGSAGGSIEPVEIGSSDLSPRLSPLTMNGASSSLGNNNGNSNDAGSFAATAVENTLNDHTTTNDDSRNVDSQAEGVPADENFDNSDERDNNNHHGGSGDDANGGSSSSPAVNRRPVASSALAPNAEMHLPE